MTPVRLVIPLRPPSKNDIKPDMGVFRFGRSGRVVPAAWARVKNLEAQWTTAIPEARADQRPLGKRRVLFTRVMGPQERYFDTWNLSGGLNSVVMDILVKKGWLVDDARDCVELPEPVQRRALPGDPEPPATLILIEDLPGAALRTEPLPFAVRSGAGGRGCGGRRRRQISPEEKASEG